jgi:cysteine desulfurase/selenocysteine lyase
LGRREIERHETALTVRALERLTDVRGLKLIGPSSPDRRIPVFTFTMAGTTPRDILRQLDAQGIAIRAGDLAALPLLKRFGVKAAARASGYLYTSTDEIDRFADALIDISGAR